MGLQLVNGKFFRDGHPVPLEFGNAEQIALMKETLNRIEALKNGIVVDPEIETYYKATITHKCICGTTVYWEEEQEYEDDIDFSGIVSSCFKCHKKYEIGKNEDEEYVVLEKLSHS